MNCNNLNDQIDHFIDVGMQYQKATAKNFKYKKFLKKTYQYLDKLNIYVNKKTKNDLEKCVQNRISERFFGHQKKSKKVNLANHNGEYFNDFMATSSCALEKNTGKASSKNPNVEYSNEFMKGIVEVGTGLAMVKFGSGWAKASGAALIGDGIIRFGGATIDYIWPERSERDRPKERDRDGERPSMRDRERDRDRSK